MSVVTQDFVAAGKPFYIIANSGVTYTDITDGIIYRQTTIPYGKNWKIISNNNVYTPNSGVTAVTTTTPLQSTGGTAPTISILQAGASSSGYLSAADWNTFSAGSSGGVPTTRLINTTSPLQGGGDLSANRTLSIPQASNAINGYLSSGDWTTFNNKGNGTVTTVTSTSPIVSSGGNTPIISIPQAGALTNGFLSSTDWGVFNGRFPYPTGTISQYIRGDGSLDTFPTIPTVTPAALTKTDDTNVTLALTGTPTTALLQAVNVAVGWAGTLADTRIASASTWNSKVSSVTATSPITSSGGATPNISSQVNKGNLIGRNSVTDGVMEEITVSTGLILSGTTLSNSLPFNTPLTTKGDVYVRNGSADTRLPIGLDTQVLLADSTATTGLKWGTNTAATPTGYYGAWQDNITQTAAASNTGYPMKFRTADITPNGISIVSDTQITFANTGIYNIQFSSQFQNLANSPQDVTIWLRKNGTDVTGSAGVVGMEARKNPGDPYHTVVGWNYVLSVVAGEYYQLVWSTTDYVNVEMRFYTAGSPPPSAASVILTVTQQSGIMAGTGITAINSLTGATQTLIAGTSGTDFTVSSAGTAHTLNLPTASATNRGALSSTDWSTFNGKQTSPWAYRQSGRWWTPSVNQLAIGSLTNAINSIRYSPFIVERDITVTQLGIAVVTSGGASTTCRLGIYSNDPTTTKPLTRLVDSGTLALDSTGVKSATGLSVVLAKELYWFAYFSNASTGTITSIANLNLPDVIGTTTLNNGPVNIYSQSLTYTSLPATAGTLTELIQASSYCIYHYY